MTLSSAPETVLTRREQQKALNPLRYHPMVNPVYIPEPVHLDARPKVLSLTALVLGLSSVLFGFTILLPLAAVVFGILGAGREPTRKAIAVTGIVTAVVFGAAWAAVTPLLLTALFA